jgi:hypothetical protein
MRSIKHMDTRERSAWVDGYLFARKTATQILRMDKAEQAECLETLQAIASFFHGAERARIDAMLTLISLKAGDE